MAATPEGKVKAMIKRRLQEQGFAPAGKPMTGRWYWMPVQGAIGTVHGIPDFVGLDAGYFWAIEAKAADGQPTDNQQARMGEIMEAGGFVMVVRTEDDMDVFFDKLEAHKHGREPLRAC